MGTLNCPDLPAFEFQVRHALSHLTEQLWANLAQLGQVMPRFAGRTVVAIMSRLPAVGESALLMAAHSPTGL